MVQRVTSTTISNTLLTDLQRAARRMADSQGRISSGKAIQRPSDGPAATLRALDTRAELRRQAQYERNATDAEGWLNMADATLMTSVERLTRARDLLVGAVNGAADQRSRDASAAEVESIRSELIDMANTSYLGRPLFAGSASTPTAYTDAGEYQGDGAPITRAIGPGSEVQVNVSGETVFGVRDPGDPANGDLFQVLEQAVADLRAGDVAAAGQGLERIDAAMDRIGVSQATLGTRARQLEAQASRNSSTTIDLKAGLSEVEDIDYAQAIIEVKTEEMAYQAALSVTAKVIQPTLIDFLR
ncbi:MAG: flagellar hook-associated protein 3 [Acidimicrobiia bacterium]|nr:flagellar hook-associated protein 3 [Acidimicrobiia bacterium]